MMKRRTQRKHEIQIIYVEDVEEHKKISSNDGRSKRSFNYSITCLRMKANEKIG